MQHKEVMDYLELTVLDFAGWIFQNICRNFFTQKLLLFTLNSNGKNEVRKVLLISFFRINEFLIFLFFTLKR